MAELKHPIEGEEYLIAITNIADNVIYYLAAYENGCFVIDNGAKATVGALVKSVMYWDLSSIGTGTLFET